MEGFFYNIVKINTFYYIYNFFTCAAFSISILNFIKNILKLFGIHFTKCTVNIAFLTSLVSKKFTAVQYALLTSFMMLPGKLFSGFSGMLADYFISITTLQTGWTYFFYTTTAMSIPALLLIILYKKTYADNSG